MKAKRMSAGYIKGAKGNHMHIRAESESKVFDTKLDEMLTEEVVIREMSRDGWYQVAMYRTTRGRYYLAGNGGNKTAFSGFKVIQFEPNTASGAWEQWYRIMVDGYGIGYEACALDSADECFGKECRPEWAHGAISNPDGTVKWSE